MRNLTTLTDLYQVNMMFAHYKNGKKDQQVVFDLFFRTSPCKSGYAIAAGLEQAIEYIQSLSFTDENISYLRQVGGYDEPFLVLLKQFTFTGDIAAIPEGTVVFPGEPLVRITASLFEAHLVETTLLTIINHQTLIATKAARVKHSAHGDAVLEFGLRRAQGPDSGLYGSRASYIGGVDATSNLMAGQMFNIPVKGTHAHAFVQSYESEYEAFKHFVEVFPNNAILLVDTYDTLKSGLPNAIRVFKEYEHEHGDKPGYYGIRLDSGDLAYLSVKARQMLNQAGFHDAKIVASSDLDEYLIRDLKVQGAHIDVWGVGTNLIVSKECPSLGGVYKLVAEEVEGQWMPKIKVSDNPEKITNPGLKKVIRFYDNETDKPIADLIMLEEEAIPTSEIEIFHPLMTYKRKRLKNYYTRELLIPIFSKGKLVYESPSLGEIRTQSINELRKFSPEMTRLVNTHEYHVNLSNLLWQLKNELIEEYRK